MIRETLTTVVLTLASASGAIGAEVAVKTLNNGPGGMMVFEPAFVRIQPGDAVRFMPADKGHNAESIKGMAPDGAAPFKTAFGKEEVVTFDKPGVYGFRCGPHYPMGMVGLVEVGDRPENLAAAKAVQHNKLAAKRFDALFERVQ